MANSEDDRQLGERLDQAWEAFRKIWLWCMLSEPHEGQGGMETGPCRSCLILYAKDGPPGMA